VRRPEGGQLEQGAEEKLTKPEKQRMKAVVALYPNLLAR
jgi:hypothetical protein